MVFIESHYDGLQERGLARTGAVGDERSIMEPLTPSFGVPSPHGRGVTR